MVLYISSNTCTCIYMYICTAIIIKCNIICTHIVIVLVCVQCVICLVEIVYTAGQQLHCHVYDFAGLTGMEFQECANYNVFSFPANCSQSLGVSEITIIIIIYWERFKELRKRGDMYRIQCIYMCLYTHIYTLVCSIY